MGVDNYTLILVLTGALMLITAWGPIVMRRLPLSLPILCLAAGAVIFTLPRAGWPPEPLSHLGFIERLTEFVVIISLMGAALKLDKLGDPRRWSYVWRLLAITMPLTILAVALLGWSMLGITALSALVLGAVLAPTDPVLASDVQVGPPGKGKNDDVRFALTAEAGLNDGLAFPFVYLAIAAAAAGGLQPGLWTLEWFGAAVLWKIFAGLVVGAAAGRAFGWLVFVERRGVKLAETHEGFAVIGLTLISYAGAELLAGYGFLAVFVAGLAFRGFERDHAYHGTLHAFATQTERIIMMAMLVLAGGVAATGTGVRLTGELFLFALILVLGIRPLAGLVAMIGCPHSWRHRLVVAFFGIRGIGSFYYTAFALNHVDFANIDTLWSAVFACIVVSIVLHGVTVTPVTRWLDEEPPFPWQRPREGRSK